MRGLTYMNRWMFLIEPGISGDVPGSPGRSTDLVAFEPVYILKIILDVFCGVGTTSGSIELSRWQPVSNPTSDKSITIVYFRFKANLVLKYSKKLRFYSH